MTDKDAVKKKVKMYKFTFGVFRAGQLLFSLGRTTCSVTDAMIIVAILDLAKEALKEDDYFACDYEGGAV